MTIVLVTGSAGLIGSESVRFFCDRSFMVVGIDNNMRSFFFGEDASTEWNRDRTEELLQQISTQNPKVRYVNNYYPNGFGFAVRCGLENFQGDAVAIVMADSSDAPENIVDYYYKLQEGYDCVFGSRFMRGGKVVDYPVHKLFVNRLANLFIQILFGLKFNDTTNAFKAYRREVIDGISPLLSHHFNLTVEIPLKAIVRGYSYATIPITWRNRATGVSKLNLESIN